MHAWFPEIACPVVQCVCVRVCVCVCIVCVCACVCVYVCVCVCVLGLGNSMIVNQTSYYSRCKIISAHAV